MGLIQRKEIHRKTKIMRHSQCGTHLIQTVGGSLLSCKAIIV